jgi:class 3 adenylate cyclase
MTPIEQWLSDLGLGQYAEQFTAADIDQDVLLELTDEDLRTLGLTLGHRKKLLRAISEHRTPAAPARPEPGDASTAEDPPRAGEDAERRQLSIVFCDLVGSTALSTRLDPEDLREVMQAYNRCCADVVDRFGGWIARFQGDGIVVLFGYPQAHEDDAARALRCALEMVAAVGRLQAWPGVALQARAGIATGPVVVGDRILNTQEPATSGHTPNLAARLQACAEPGQVLIEPLTRRLVGGMFACVELGTRELKGVAQPVPVWRVDAFREGNRFAASHLDEMTEMIGREHELGLLLHRWREAESGEGRVVLLSGEPGIGKSRLVAALLNRLPDHVRKPIWQCSPHRTNTALYPAIEQLMEAVRFLPEDATETKLEKLERVVGDQAAPVLADLLSIPTGDRYPAQSLTPAERKQRTLDAMLGQLRKIAAQGPVCFVVEDVHWIDPTTLELLDHAADLVQRLRVLMILIFRADYQIPWRLRGHVSGLSLHRLNRTECARVAELAARGAKLPPELVDRIIDRTDGVPLFVEELTRSTPESGVLERIEEGASLPSALTSEAIPSSLQSSLIGRLDRLSSVKHVAQVAAAIGREFPRDLLAAVAGYSAATLDRALEQLVLADIVHRRSSAAVQLYAFRHALIQDAAYGSLLRGKRRELHARIADVLESRLSGRTVAEPDLLAHHLTEAGKNERAVAYWLKAAQQAAERSANRETVAHTERGLRLLATLPPSSEKDRQERALQSTRLVAATSVFGFSSDEWNTSTSGCEPCIARETIREISTWRSTENTSSE